MIKLTIIEDDLNFAINLFNFISDKLNNIEIKNIFVDGTEYINPQNTDILLLDLEMPNVNGIELLDFFKKSNYIIPYIIVISGNSDLLLKSKVYMDEVYKVYMKPIDMENLITTLSNIEKNFREQDIKHMIYTELSIFNFNKKMMGYQYIIDAIELSLENEIYLNDLKNNLYPIICKKHNLTNTLKVKWSIEQCIDNLYKTTNINILNNYFHIDSCNKLTPKQFIVLVVENIKQRNEIKLF